MWIDESLGDKFGSWRTLSSVRAWFVKTFRWSAIVDRQLSVAVAIFLLLEQGSEDINLCEEWVIWSMALEFMTQELDKVVHETFNAYGEGNLPLNAEERVLVFVGFSSVPYKLFNFSVFSLLNLPCSWELPFLPDYVIWACPCPFSCPFFTVEFLFGIGGFP